MASQGRQAGKDPTNAPASTPAARSRSMNGRRRSLRAAARLCGLRFGRVQPKGLCSGPMRRAFACHIARLAAARPRRRWPRPTCASRRTAPRPIRTGRFPAASPSTLQPAQTYSAPPAPSARLEPAARRAGALEAANFHYQSCALSPRNDETFTNPGIGAVSLALTPSLRAGDTRDHDGRRSQSVERQPATIATRCLQPRSRHAYRDRAGDGSLRQDGVRREHHVSRACGPG